MTTHFLDSFFVVAVNILVGVDEKGSVTTDVKQGGSLEEVCFRL